jgi:hypothetical protein
MSAWLEMRRLLARMCGARGDESLEVVDSSSTQVTRGAVPDEDYLHSETFLSKSPAWRGDLDV